MPWKTGQYAQEDAGEAEVSARKGGDERMGEGAWGRAYEEAGRSERRRGREWTRSAVGGSEVAVGADPVGDIGGDLAGGGAGGEEGADADVVELLPVGIGDDASAGEEHVVHSFFLHQPDDPREYCHVGAAEDADADRVDVFLEGGVDDHFRRLPKAGIDDFHAGIAEGGCDDAGAPVMAVEANFGHQHADGAAGGVALAAGGAALVGGRARAGGAALEVGRLVHAIFVEAQK
jgi:hypothetical protein